MALKTVYVGEKMPESLTKSIFLAGPTPRNKDEVESWRPDAIKILEDKGFDGVVFVPEKRDKQYTHSYDDQIEWEEKYLNVADCIVFWVLRDLTLDTKDFPKMAAFTTNVEWGAWADSGKVVFGAPPDAPKNSYLKYYAEKYKAPTAETLTETLDDAMEMLGDGAERSSGERYVPLFIWKTPAFQSWYKAQTDADNKLVDAKLLYTFRPGYKSFVFLWILKVNVYITAENRNKTNEFVLARPDISSVMMWRPEPTLDTEVVLIKEFRSPASTTDGFVRELPGGSANATPEETASEEIHEETGLYIDPSRLQFHEARQLVATLSSHKSHLYSVELTEKEMEWLISQKGIVHGIEEDTERTFVEIYSIQDLINKDLVDWSTLGMILSVYHDYVG